MDMSPEPIQQHEPRWPSLVALLGVSGLSYALPMP